jgi:ABC-type multidrug transport system fused ATPase/permease subunit
MLPAWMNLVAIVAMASTLANMVGVSEVMTVAREILTAEQRQDLLLPMYGYLLMVLRLLLSDRAVDAIAGAPMVRCDLIAAAIAFGPRPSPDVIVSMDNVHKAYQGTPVLRGISMDVRRSEVICIIGPSGSGKSTLLRCTNALTPIDSGTISVCGLDVASPQLDKLALRRSPSISPPAALHTRLATGLLTAPGTSLPYTTRGRPGV